LCLVDFRSQFDRHLYFYMTQNDDLLLIKLLQFWTFLLRSPASVARWPEYVFISEGNPHLKSRFCRVELGPIPDFKTFSDIGMVGIDLGIQKLSLFFLFLSNC
jgi:hypothetical protein